MPRFQLVVETVLRNPNIQPYVQSFEAAMARVSAQGRARADTMHLPANRRLGEGPRTLGRNARDSLVSAEAAIIGQARAGLITPREAVVARRALRQRFEATIAATEAQIGTALLETGRARSGPAMRPYADVRSRVAQLVGQTPAQRQQNTQAQQLYPNAGGNPARPHPTYNLVRTRLDADMAAIARVDQQYIRERGRLIDAVRRLRDVEARAADKLDDPARQQAHERLLADRLLNRHAARVGATRNPGETEDAFRGRVTALNRQRAIQREAAATEATTAQHVTDAGQTRAAKRRLNRAIEAEEKAHRRATATEEERGLPSQRLFNLANDHPGRNLMPGDERTGTQLMTGRFITTASYGAAAAVLYGIVNQLQEGAREALKLQDVTEQLRAQFESLEAPGVEKFRTDLLEIARNTGALGSEVLFVGLQMQGAFRDTETAVSRTAEAIRAAQVSGLPLAEIVDSLTAASKSYGGTIDDITDKSIGLQERFGVTIQQSIKSFGDLSTVAQAAGLSVNEVGGILGVIQQRSGRSLGAITEGLSRVLPAIQERAGDILTFASRNPTLRPQLGEFQDAIRSGQSGPVLLKLAENWENLDQAARNYVITLLGGRREAQYLIPLFEGHADLMREVAIGNEDAGKAAEYQAAKQRTLTYQMMRVREEFI